MKPLFEHCFPKNTNQLSIIAWIIFLVLFTSFVIIFIIIVTICVKKSKSSSISSKKKSNASQSSKDISTIEGNKTVVTSKDSVFGDSKDSKNQQKKGSITKDLDRYHNIYFENSVSNERTSESKESNLKF